MLNFAITIQSQNRDGSGSVSNCAKTTFKYHMTLRGGGGLLKPSECCHMGERVMAKSSYNFYSG